MDPHDVNEAGGDEAAPSENHHTLKSPGNADATIALKPEILFSNSIIDRITYLYLNCVFYTKV
jgi:hypothetical protein